MKKLVFLFVAFAAVSFASFAYSPPCFTKLVTNGLYCHQKTFLTSLYFLFNHLYYPIISIFVSSIALR